MERMTATQAAKAKIRQFESKYPCKTCGGHARYLESWSASSVVCLGCEAPGGLSLCKIRVAENQANKAKKKLLAQPGPLPVAFRGYSTI